MDTLKSLFGIKPAAATRKQRKQRKQRKNLRGGGGCSAMAEPNSLSQGRAFQDMTRNLHGGRRRRASSCGEDAQRLDSRRRMRGGGSTPMSYPFTDSTLLQGSLRAEAGVAGQDQFYQESQTSIPSNIRYNQGGGGMAPAPLSQPDMLLSRTASDMALNPQWKTEGATNPEIGRMAQAEMEYRSTNMVPGFAGPVNAYQTQAGGRRRSRRHRRASRRASCRDRRASRKH